MENPKPNAILILWDEKEERHAQPIEVYLPEETVRAQVIIRLVGEAGPAVRVFQRVGYRGKLFQFREAERIAVVPVVPGEVGWEASQVTVK